MKIPRLTQDEVQVWWIDLAEANSDEEGYLRLLTPDEVERAARLRAGQVRMQFLAGRSSLRRLLAAEFGVDPEKASIVTSEYGKPELAPPHVGRVHFNVAHSRSTVLIALTLTGPVGIDLEYLDRETDIMEVARHSLTNSEAAAMQAIADFSLRTEEFFRCWTRKEAIVKADGRGLSLPLTSFEVPLGPLFGPWELKVPVDDQKSSQRYFVSDISFGRGTACSLATSEKSFSLRLLRFPPSGFVQ